ncbi:MAG: 5'/3'-nucleotidase SurE [Acidimicrobiia bacterium]
MTAVIAALAVPFAACSDDGSDSGESITDGGLPDTGSPKTGDTAEPFTILVSNDDGVGAEGIDLLVEGLRRLPAEVIVYAPATNQTGAGNRTSPGPVAQSDRETRSGFPAIAVEGTPADSVNVALDTGIVPDLVVTGVNEGANLGPLAIDVSGTVGAARAAANRGFTALAVSQGLGEPIDYESGVDEAVRWVRDDRDELADGDAPVALLSLNVPTCTSGEVKGVVEAPLATAVPPEALGPVDCSAGSNATADDVEALLNGYAALSELPLGSR